MRSPTEVAVPVSAIVSQLRSLGVSDGDLLMIHASLSEVGAVETGADGLITAIEQAVSPGGTLLMVLGAADDWAWVNDHPEQQRAALLADAVPFDPHATPAHPDIGVLAEVFRRRAGTSVSDHPEGRFAARGLRAQEMLACQPLNDYYGPGSPLERLVDLGGKILRLGADLDTTTVLHYAEYLAPIESKRRVCRHRRIAHPAGPRIVRIECLDDEHGIVPRAGEDYFATILRSYLASGGARTGLVGEAQSELISAADLVRFGVSWMGQHLC